MHRFVHTIYAVIFLCVLLSQSVAQELVFLSAEEAGNILANKDDFVKLMSPFDRASRMKTDRDVTNAEFLEFAASAALDWEKNEKSRINSAFQDINDSVTSLSLPLPGEIYLVKTSGKEEGNAAYTRGNAIVLPSSILSSTDLEIKKLLAHELFHISSRSNPQLARSLYKTIGFNYCGELQFPPSLAQRKITNPDAPKNDHCIQLELDGEIIWAVPILLSRTQKYDTSRGGEFFDYLQLALILVEKPGNSDTPRVLSGPQGPRLVGLSQVSGFFEQVGKNTQYIIHPEEILADNFALLVLGNREVASPEVLDKMSGTLSKTK